VEVKKDGQVELTVPFPTGAHVTVFVVESGDIFQDLIGAAESSLEFWNNPWDNEEWNNA